MVLLICFDNREELARKAPGQRMPASARRCRLKLDAWAVNMNGFLKRLNGERYLVLTDEEHIQGMMDSRFPILDEIRNIKNENNQSATISRRRGAGASSRKEGESFGRRALDMALGRGDQVAVKIRKMHTYEVLRRPLERCGKAGQGAHSGHCGNAVGPCQGQRCCLCNGPKVSRILTAWARRVACGAPSVR